MPPIHRPAAGLKASSERGTAMPAAAARPKPLRGCLIIAAAAALPLVGAAALSTAHAEAIDCNWYAATALSQQQQNERGKCGFRGPEWSSDRQAHLTWCAGQAPDRWKKEAQRRERLLADCRR
jgi:hypothetical protein